MTENDKIRFVRRPQTITPFGPGAIIDIEGESFVAADVSCWGNRGEIIRESRLERLLGVKHFRMAPAAPEFMYYINESTPGVPYVRFPRWMFCSQCRRMYFIWSKKETPVCNYCVNSPALTPMRFVVACPRGHLDDVPWDFWAHSSRGRKCEDPDLRFVTSPGGSGLEFVSVECKRCGANRSLAGIAVPDSLKKLNVKCTGRHPWLPFDKHDECDAVPQVLQRGATNLTFALIESAIDIPPYSQWREYSSDITVITTHSMYPALKKAYEMDNTEFVSFCINQISVETNIHGEMVRSVLLQDLRQPDEPGYRRSYISYSDTAALLEEEYNALTATDQIYDPRDNFIKRDVTLNEYPGKDTSDEFQDATAELKLSLDQLVQITRLREVRVLRAFSRLSPPEGTDDLDEEPPGRFSLYDSSRKISPLPVPADLGKLPPGERFLPAIQVYGEGIFFTLNEDRLQEWEHDENVLIRVARLVSRRNESARYLPPVTPRLVLLHTLSHLLIRELSFECGYSIASMRERIYPSQSDNIEMPMAGIMIYTAAGDAEGTLGGLVRQGDPDRFFPVLIRAIQNSVWCSSDPLCRESQGQGLFGLNLAACHACSLLPETSCTMSNRLLDRVMLAGTLDGTVKGYFSPLIDLIYQEGFDTLLAGG